MLLVLLPVNFVNLVSKGHPNNIFMLQYLKATNFYKFITTFIIIDG